MVQKGNPDSSGQPIFKKAQETERNSNAQTCVHKNIEQTEQRATTYRFHTSVRFRPQASENHYSSSTAIIWCVHEPNDKFLLILQR